MEVKEGLKKKKRPVIILMLSSKKNNKKNIRKTGNQHLRLFKYV